MTEQLGRFGHHPDPSIDFCVEVDVIEGMAYDASVGMADMDEVRRKIDRALPFRRLDEIGLIAREWLRKLEASLDGRTQEIALPGGAIGFVRPFSQETQDGR